ncbi:hypothetical protein PGT21_000696 [Puccinia graminis f. sp. tritici]|uniref:Uncharacterized protein n=1 Tax=Puccinia graminis f. sp. tritici TaxID=56615 RepID=A0A5B0Q0R0_PUCGR|nr:hypothetical protein PGT21_000696 [Puccinia graminis f. sp. tritici]
MRPDNPSARTSIPEISFNDNRFQTSPFNVEVSNTTRSNGGLTPSHESRSSGLPDQRLGHRKKHSSISRDSSIGF